MAILVGVSRLEQLTQSWMPWTMDLYQYRWSLLGAGDFVKMKSEYYLQYPYPKEETPGRIDLRRDLSNCSSANLSNAGLKGVPDFANLYRATTGYGLRDKANMKPNIVIILVDDLGWNDVSYHNENVSTPNIDRLAKAGVELDRFYVNPTCSPTKLP